MNEHDIDLNVQLSIFSEILGEVSLNRKYKNPFRNDRKPDCFITIKDNVLYFADYAKAKHYNCVHFYQEKYSVSYVQAFHKILNRYKLDNGFLTLYSFNDKYNSSKGVIKNENYATLGTSSTSNTSNILLPSDFEIKKEKKEYTFVYQDFDKYDLEYWNQFQFDRNFLEFLKIKSVNKVFENGKLFLLKDFRPIFTYNDNFGEFKIYNPLGFDWKKWRTIRSKLEGYDLLGKYEVLDKYKDVLFITSSYKDAGVLIKLKMNAFANCNEGSYYHILNNLEELKKYKYVYTFFNSDEAGKTASLKLNSITNFNYINLPDKYLPINDQSDFIKSGHSYKELNEIIDEKLNRDNVWK